MDEDQHERAVGETFIAWYNAKHRTAFKLIGRVDERPDLVFRDRDQELCAQVTTSARTRPATARNHFIDPPGVTAN